MIKTLLAVLGLALDERLPAAQALARSDSAFGIITSVLFSLGFAALGWVLWRTATTPSPAVTA